MKTRSRARRGGDPSVDATAQWRGRIHTGVPIPSFASFVLATVLAALLAVWPVPAHAQAGGSARYPDSSCLANIPDSVLRRVPVYVQAELTDAADRSIFQGLDLLTQELADSMRSLLGGAANELPDGGTAMTWKALDASVHVVLRRDGSVESVVHRSADANRPDTTAAHLLARALGSVTSDGKYFMVWPEGFASDSVAFRIAMHYPFVNEEGVTGTPTLRQAFAIFSLPVPRIRPVVAVHLSPPHYPGDAEDRRVTGSILMQFIVDTTGHAEMATVKDLWPRNVPRLTGAKRVYYEDFRKSVVESISQSTFRPARVGGCTIRQLVQMPFAFKVRK